MSPDRLYQIVKAFVSSIISLHRIANMCGNDSHLSHSAVAILCPEHGIQSLGLRIQSDQRSYYSTYLRTREASIIDNVNPRVFIIFSRVVASDSAFPFNQIPSHCSLIRVSMFFKNPPCKRTMVLLLSQHSGCFRKHQGMHT